MNFYSQDAHRFFQLKLAEAFKEKIIGLINEGLINEAWMHFLHFLIPIIRHIICVKADLF